MNNPIDLESLECFVAAAARLSFRSAAAAVHLSPAAFGERIKRLEEGIEAKLFERTTRRVRLTAAGRRLLPRAERLLAEAERCRAAVHDGAAELPYELTLGTRYELGMSWLVPAVPELAERVRARRIHLYFGDSDALLGRLQDGRIDAMVSSVRLTSAGLDYAPLHEEAYTFVASPKLLARRPLNTAEDARTHTLIDSHPNLPLFRYFLDAAAPEPAWAFAELEYMGTIGAIRLRLLDQAGVAVLPLYFVREDLAKKRLVRVQKEVEPSSDWFRLVWRAGHPFAEELRKLAEELRAMPLR